MSEKVVKLKKNVLKKLKDYHEVTITLKSNTAYKTSNKNLALKLIELYSEDIVSIK